MAKMTMVQALNLALRQEMQKDDSIIVLGEDVGVNGGVFRVTDGLTHQFGDQRVLDTPLAESGIEMGFTNPISITTRISPAREMSPT